jgi:hypothetical protein
MVSQVVDWTGKVPRWRRGVVPLNYNDNYEHCLLNSMPLIAEGNNYNNNYEYQPSVTA